jgi:hypothetical protein
MISNAFEDTSAETMEALNSLTESIVTIIEEDHSKAPAPLVVPVSKTKSKTKSTGEKRKGNTYSHFVGVVAAHARGDTTHADKMVTVVRRDGLSENTGKNIIDNEDSITYDTEMTFTDFFDMISVFESQPMKRSAIMWGLISNEDRKKFDD